MVDGPAHLPSSEACLRNRDPIRDALATIATAGESVLEIGAGTGQHAVHLADALAVDWQPTELADRLDVIRGWIEATGVRRVREPLALDVLAGPWPDPGSYDGVFSANTAHIVAWEGVLALLAGVARVLRPGGWFALYGPFNEGGRFTSEGNERLDAWARATFAGGGLRDRAAVEAAAGHAGLTAADRRMMPANNQLLVFRRAAGGRGDASEKTP